MKVYAKSRQRSLSELVKKYFENVINEQVEINADTPIVNSIKG